MVLDARVPLGQHRITIGGLPPSFAIDQALPLGI